MAGRLDKLVVTSDVLAENPLGDPARRPLYVYQPPGLLAGAPGKGVPTIYVLQGFASQLDQWLSRATLQPTMIERLDSMFASRECPDAVVVFVDAWTSRGGSQFLNSASTGRYLDYLCDEVVPFVERRYPVLAGREHRGLSGKSSGGYGAMVVPMLRPGIFGGLASHSGDALFECAYARTFPVVARELRDRFDGSYDVFHRSMAEAANFDWGRFGAPFEMYGYACAYSPDPSRAGEALLPFDIATGRIVEEVWEKWLERDPVRMAAGHAAALRSMRRIYLDAGRSDEYFLDLGAKAFSIELSKLGVGHTLELFEGRHGGTAHRYPHAVRELVLALGQ